MGYEEFVRLTVQALFKKYGAAVHSSRHYRGRSGHNHQIDVSVDLTVASFRILILFECKHYKRTVSVEDLLAFAQRLSDIGAHKGVVVSTVGFQEGAKKVAEAHGIALVTTVPRRRSSWKLAFEHISGCEDGRHHDQGERDAAHHDKEYYTGRDSGRKDYDKGWEDGRHHDQSERDTAHHDKEYYTGRDSGRKDYDKGWEDGRGIDSDGSDSQRAAEEPKIPAEEEGVRDGGDNFPEEKYEEDARLTTVALLGRLENSRDFGEGLHAIVRDLAQHHIDSLDLPINCPQCGSTELKRSEHSCPSCRRPVSKDAFKERSWIKCDCSKMLHSGDMNVVYAACACGNFFSLTKVMTEKRQRMQHLIP